MKLLQPLPLLQILETLVTITKTEALTTTANMTSKRGATHESAMEAGEDLGTTGRYQPVANTHTVNDKDGAETSNLVIDIAISIRNSMQV